MFAGVQPADVIDAATRAGATIIRAPGTVVIVLTDAAPTGDDLVPEPKAAELAQCTVRTLRAARRNREIDAFGKQRSRAYRRADLMAWIESRRVRPVAGADDDDIARRMKRIGGSR